MEIQEAFDKIVEHAKLGIISRNGQNVCRLRGNNGSKCFIGVLIDDSKYEVNLEMAAMKELITAAGVADGVFLRSMQLIHDNTTPHGWRSQLKEYAEQHNLQFNW